MDELIQYSARQPSNKTGHITRFEMYRRLTDALKPYDHFGKTALSISGSTRLAQICGLTQTTIHEISYPEYDVLSLPFQSEQFDFIIADQVFEHVQGDIAKIYRDLAGMLRPGGFLVSATPFVTEIHPAPLDCWRFAPDGLRWLATQAGLEIFLCDGWGNRSVWLAIMLGYRFTPVPEDENHPIFKLATFDEKDFPIHVWLICRKPELPLPHDDKGDEESPKLKDLQYKLQQSEASLLAVYGSTSWKMTYPLRKMNSLFKRMKFTKSP